MIYTAANSHLGDCAWFCHVLRRIPGPHVYYVPVEYHWQIAECLEGCDVELRDVKDAPPDALNTWIACGRFECMGVRYENNIDIVDYLHRWDNALLFEAGNALALKERKDLLFDFPAIRRNVVAPEFDVLVVNAAPRSGQCPKWSNHEMDDLIKLLSDRYKVVTTNNTTVEAVNTISASVCSIGNLALRAQFVVAVGTGPSWCIHSIWSGHIPSYVFLDPIRLDYGRTNLKHAASIPEMISLLESDKLL